MCVEEIDASSAGVAEVTCRLVAKTSGHLEAAEFSCAGEKESPGGAAR